MTLGLVPGDSTGTIAAVAIAFSRFPGVLWPEISPHHLVFDGGLLALPGVGDLSLSLSTQQLVAILSVLLLTGTNLTSLRTGKWIQVLFTLAKIGALTGLIGFGRATPSAGNGRVTVKP